MLKRRSCISGGSLRETIKLNPSQQKLIVHRETREPASLGQLGEKS